jgi:putative tryptophan/tyrosine transport system substrate-binding protein
MRRRSFITLLGSLASWPSAVCAQQSAMQTIGFLNSASPAPFASYVAAFRRGLQDEGYIEGQNLAIEFRWADGQTDRLASLAVDLVSHGVFVVAATGGPIPAAAAKAATETIPIVFAMAGGPVKRGLVASFSRPGGKQRPERWSGTSDRFGRESLLSHRAADEQIG